MTRVDFFWYLIQCVAILTLLAPIAISMWAWIVFKLLKRLGVNVEESFSVVSKNKIIFVCVFMASSSYIMGSVFSRFV